MKISIFLAAIFGYLMILSGVGEIVSMILADVWHTGSSHDLPGVFVTGVVLFGAVTLVSMMVAGAIYFIQDGAGSD